MEEVRAGTGFLGCSVRTCESRIPPPKLPATLQGCNRELVALFATLVNNLGIQTLAEGVETRECHDILVQMGFQLGQGYYYGRPAPISKYDLEIEKKSGESLRDYQDTESSVIITNDD